MRGEVRANPWVRGVVSTKVPRSWLRVKVRARRRAKPQRPRAREASSWSSLLAPDGRRGWEGRWSWFLESESVTGGEAAAGSELVRAGGAAAGSETVGAGEAAAGSELVREKQHEVNTPLFWYDAKNTPQKN